MGHGTEVEMPHDEHDPFVKRIAMCVAIYAVALAIAGAGGKNAGKDMLSEQIETSNQWSRYQAKAVREAIYINDLEKFELDKEKGGLTPEATAKLDKSMERVKKKIDDYKTTRKIAISTTPSCCSKLQLCWLRLLCSRRPAGHS
jgi:Domain of unknown function (DUF4337)